MSNYTGDLRDGLSKIKTLQEFPYPLAAEEFPIEICPEHRREYVNESGRKEFDCPECRADAIRSVKAGLARKTAEPLPETPSEAKGYDYSSVVTLIAVTALVSFWAGACVEYAFRLLR